MPDNAYKLLAQIQRASQRCRPAASRAIVSKQSVLRLQTTVCPLLLLPVVETTDHQGHDFAIENTEAVGDDGIDGGHTGY